VGVVHIASNRMKLLMSEQNDSLHRMDHLISLNDILRSSL